MPGQTFYHRRHIYGACHLYESSYVSKLTSRSKRFAIEVLLYVHYGMNTYETNKCIKTK